MVKMTTKRSLFMATVGSALSIVLFGCELRESARGPVGSRPVEPTYTVITTSPDGSWTARGVTLDEYRRSRAQSGSTSNSANSTRTTATSEQSEDVTQGAESSCGLDDPEASPRASYASWLESYKWDEPEGALGSPDGQATVSANDTSDSPILICGFNETMLATHVVLKGHRSTHPGESVLHIFVSSDESGDDWNFVGDVRGMVSDVSFAPTLVRRVKIVQAQERPGQQDYIDAVGIF